MFFFGGGDCQNSYLVGFLKNGGFPQQPMGFVLLKMIMIWGVKWGVPPFKETPTCTSAVWLSIDRFNSFLTRRILTIRATKCQKQLGKWQNLPHPALHPDSTLLFFRENWIGQTFRMVDTCWDRLKPHQLKHFFFGGMILWNNRINFC